MTNGGNSLSGVDDSEGLGYHRLAGIPPAFLQVPVGDGLFAGGCP